MNYKITVLVLTYNPDLLKLQSTLKSIILQKNIDFNIVIADDGSKEFDWELVKDFFIKHSFTDYLIVNNEYNLGTVKNTYSGLVNIDSDYTFTISPGDLLFDVMTLYNIYEYCKKFDDCSFFFGEAVYYEIKGNKIVTGETLFPKLPHIYDYNAYPWIISSTAYFSRQHICGASYFYRTETFRKYLSEAIDIGVKYVEDFSTAALYILDKEQIVYFDRNVVWYESNTGVSGSRNPKWDKILNDDIDRLKDHLKEKYKSSAIVNAKYGDFKERIKHPIIVSIAIAIIVISKFKRNIPQIDYNDINYLTELINDLST